MPRFFLAPLLAAAVALTPIAAAPARAADDLARILLGAAAVYVIVDKLESNRRAVNRVEKSQAAGWQSPRGYNRHQVIPASCVRTINTRRGPERVVTERCLRNEGIRRLPDRCEISVRGNRGSVDAYRLSCLQNAGYRVEGRRR
ncbi:hypothetical protein [Rhodovulum steppense]|uniref:Uncharacterized protein n=1 Tax=Rhodovulum steppense TaxID=540251 RepID=A0A4R1Z1U9_9RHOB|nr:hypothetical protein [Rhodovulum steppense]TCM87567.1 hypothetical protein EV216_102120 [Rhodovulum steppense]